MTDWNPNLYLKFEKERTQPVKDLISHIIREDPKRIIDIGCGPGNSTKELKERWPRAHIIGLDNSPNMIEEARKDISDIDWVVADAGTDLSHLGKFDIVFSNAAIQWIPDHKSLLVKLFEMLNINGVLAVQVPNVAEMAINIAVQTTVKDKKWEKYFIESKNELYYELYDFYYDILCILTNQISLWETYYYHVIDGHKGIIEWYKSTGMKPYLDKLPDEKLKNEFADDVLRITRSKYKIQKDGNVLFPFRRLFFMANNSL